MTMLYARNFACPFCNAHLEKIGTLSSHSFGMNQWSDLKVSNGIIPSNEQIETCPSCDQPFWLSDAKDVDPKNAEQPKHLMNWDWLLDLDSENRFLVLIDRHFYRNSKEERYLRIRAWQVFNEKYRLNLSTVYELSDAMYQNLQNLLTLLGDTLSDLLVESEIYREFGDFETSLSILHALPTSNLDEVKKKLIALNEQRVRTVVQF